MEAFPIPWLIAAAFVGGVAVGYAIRAFISAKHRTSARRRRRDFK
jgi:hypothetical protein